MNHQQTSDSSLPSKTPREARCQPQVENVDVVLDTKWSLLSPLIIAGDSTSSTEKHSVFPANKSASLESGLVVSTVYLHWHFSTRLRAHFCSLLLPSEGPLFTSGHTESGAELSVAPLSSTLFTFMKLVLIHRLESLAAWSPGWSSLSPTRMGWMYRTQVELVVGLCCCTRFGALHWMVPLLPHK